MFRTSKVLAANTSEREPVCHGVHANLNVSRTSVATRRNIEHGPANWVEIRFSTQRFHFLVLSFNHLWHHDGCTKTKCSQRWEGCPRGG